MKRIIFLFAVFCIFGSLVSAQTEHISVDKSTAEIIDLEGTIEVTITLRNNLNENADVIVEEHLSGILIYPEENLIEDDGIYSRPPFLRWNLTLYPHDERDITYTIKPVEAAMLIIPPTSVYYGNEYFESNSVEIEILCNSNGICETAKGEDYFTCPNDCTTGIEDGGCDILEDGKCDPDCEEGFDPDCDTEKDGSEDGAAVDESGYLNVLAIVSVSLFVAILIVLYMLKRKNKKEPQAELNYLR